MHCSTLAGCSTNFLEVRESFLKAVALRTDLFINILAVIATLLLRPD